MLGGGVGGPGFNQRQRNHVRAECTLEELFEGCTKVLRTQSAGTVRAKIPAGAEDGSKWDAGDVTVVVK